jgi:hypothetical protein
MQKFMIMASLVLLSTPVAAVTNNNCTLAQKELNLIKSQQDMMVEKYKISIKQNLSEQVKTQSDGKLSVNVDPNNEFVKAIAKLSVAGATLEAILDLCKDGALNTSAPKKGPDDYTAQLIPK